MFCWCFGAGSLTAIFRSWGHTTFVCRQQRSMITTCLRFDQKRRRLIFFLNCFSWLVFVFVLYCLLLHCFHGQLPPHLLGNQESGIQDVLRRALRQANQAILRHWWPDYEMTEGNILCNWWSGPHSSMPRLAIHTGWPQCMSKFVPLYSHTVLLTNLLVSQGLHTVPAWHVAWGVADAPSWGYQSSSLNCNCLEDTLAVGVHHEDGRSYFMKPTYLPT